MEPQRTARYYYLKLLRLKGDPYSLARGVAVGVGVGIIPIVPLQTLIILILAPLLRGNSIAGILAGLLISNPFTLLPQYYLAWKVGKLIYPVEVSWSRVQETLEFAFAGGNSATFGDRLAAFGHLGYEAIAILILGGLILAIPLVLLAYPLSLRLFLTINRKRREKHILS
ncbi:DUF2062 domain-containing protein [Desulfurivibrio alkaliphilus]|uniref:DUF2062 domain-containing protein n=1 Tax=Desulfurivibrio alkaliphilus (strain DSM 19089 / UNIQEM U267 / AHT2) TaxID=589865 RepID=D6Z168_DESAT|nr:DUF2062 domain-containing protein [Desulfurivibrio alkaliphilus]ADH85323.1 Protein of unknown function DUF2062 [Desulfurivibrio alkaliphilus AHT 2]